MAITRLNNNSVTSVSALPNLASLPSGIPTGKVLQVKQSTKTDSSTISMATGSLYTFWTQTITPSSTSSKILVSFVVYMGQQATSAQPYIVLKRDSSNIFYADAIGSRQRSTASAGYFTNESTGPTTQWYLDSPSSTSELSYTLNGGGYNSRTWYINIPDINGNYVNSCTSTFTLMEIAG